MRLIAQLTLTGYVYCVNIVETSLPSQELVKVLIPQQRTTAVWNHVEHAFS